MTTEKIFSCDSPYIFDTFMSKNEKTSNMNNINNKHYIDFVNGSGPVFLSYNLPEKQSVELFKNKESCDSSKTKESCESTKCSSFSQVDSKINIFQCRSAFKKIGNRFTSSSISDIYQNPTMYQKVISSSERHGLKFHLLCRECQHTFFEKTNKKNYYYLSKLKVEQVFSFFIKSEKKNSKIIRFEVSSVKKKRKMDRDCVHKKIKARLFKYIKEMMKSFILDDFSNLKIQQKVISDVTLDFNKNLLASPLSTVFVESYLYFSSMKRISEICKKNKELELNNFLNKTVGQCYEDYLKSESFVKDMEKFKNESYVSTFKAYSLCFIEYYNQEMNYRKYKKI